MSLGETHHLTQITHLFDLLAHALSRSTASIHGYYWQHFSALSYFFFFSSRRRHTRLQGDWSSDVCSSDLRRTGADTNQARTESENSFQNRLLAPANRRCPPCPSGSEMFPLPAAGRRESPDRKSVV